MHVHWFDLFLGVSYLRLSIGSSVSAAEGLVATEKQGLRKSLRRHPIILVSDELAWRAPLLLRQTEIIDLA
jgi:hypothetical protein